MQLTDKAGARLSTVAVVVWGVESAADACVALLAAVLPRFWLGPSTRHGDLDKTTHTQRSPNRTNPGMKPWGGGGGGIAPGGGGFFFLGKLFVRIPKKKLKPTKEHG